MPRDFRYDDLTTWFWRLLGIALLGFLCVMGYRGYVSFQRSMSIPEYMRDAPPPPPAPEYKVAARFQDYLEQGKSRKAWAMLSPEAKRAISLEAFTAAGTDPQAVRKLFRDAVLPVPHIGTFKDLGEKWGSVSILLRVTQDLQIANFTILELPPP